MAELENPGRAPGTLRLPPALRGDPDPGFLRVLLHGLYDLAWVVALLLGSPWLLWRSLRSPAFARMVRERLGRGLARIPAASRPRVLVHGVSVGEVKAARALVEALERRHPGCEVVLCSTTHTGTEVAAKLFPAHLRVRFPADLSWIVRRFLARVDPVLVVLVELEVWPNFLRECNREGRAVAVVNGRITRGSHGRYVFFRRWLPEFNRISLFCAQSEEYARRFKELGIDAARVCVTGNVKFDGLRVGALEPGAELERWIAPAAGQVVVVAGSTHEPEELAVAEAVRANVPAARLVLVPRHPDRALELSARLRAAGMPVQRLTELRAGERADPARPLLVDTIGELERVYALADLVFVGGSLIPHGGQNMLEPAAQGKAVLFGPHVDNFDQEAALLTAAGAAERVADAAELGRALARLAADPGARQRMGAAGMAAVAAQRGATAHTLQALESMGLPALAPVGQPG